MLSEKSRLRHWKKVAEETLLATPVYTAYRETFSHPDLKKSPVDFYTIQPRDGVNIIACDQDSLHHPHAKLLWVRQFRPSVNTTTLEFPGGGIEHDDPDLISNAQRELLEETACTAQRWLYLGKTQSNAGFLKSHLSTFVAFGVHTSGKDPEGDGHEIVEVEWRPFKDRFMGLLSGETIHASTLNALALLEAHMSEKTAASKQF